MNHFAILHSFLPNLRASCLRVKAKLRLHWRSVGKEKYFLYSSTRILPQHFSPELRAPENILQS